MDNKTLVFLKYDCPTCELVRPLLADIQQNDPSLRVIVQDDSALFSDLDVQKDNDLKLDRIDGMSFNILKDKWSLSDDKSVNYITKFIKN